MRISLIAAMAANRTIGIDGRLPWRIPEDMTFFKRTTMGKPLVMGRKTFESIGGKPLPGRPCVVVTENWDFTVPEGVVVAHDIDTALRAAMDLAKDAGMDEIMVAGGGRIYEQVLDRADRLYLTEVHETYAGDAHFPIIDRSVWKEIAREDHAGDPGYSFVTLERAAATS